MFATCGLVNPKRSGCGVRKEKAPRNLKVLKGHLPESLGNLQQLTKLELQGGPPYTLNPILEFWVSGFGRRGIGKK